MVGRKRGRPRIAPQSRRVVPVKVLFTRTESDALYRVAMRKRSTLAMLIRQVSLAVLLDDSGARLTSFK